LVSIQILQIYCFGPRADSIQNVQDVEMTTTPIVSRSSSEDVNGMSSITMPQNQNCCCRTDPRYDLPIQHSTPDVTVARAAYNMAGQYPRLPVNDLLNSASPNDDQYSNETRTLGINNASTSVNGSGQARTISSSSAMSISSTDTLHHQFSIAEERMFLVSELYYRCRDASASYRRSLSTINRHPSRASRTSSSGHFRHKPYGRRSRPGQQAHQINVNRPQSLMDNISAICTHMWRGARSDALAPRREEAEAVRMMRDLYVWGEIIIRRYQSDDFEDTIMNCGRATGSLSSSAGNDIWSRVGEAAKNLCEWFANDEALASCEGIANKLRELKEKEDGGESSDGFGGIL
jgi:hypothetical protein